MPKHHFVPAFYLQQWANSDDELIEYSRPHHKVVSKPIGPRGTGYEFDLYAFKELPPEDAQFIERRFFDYADRVGSTALQKHLANAGASEWTSEIISAWSRFIIALHIRHPDTMPELRAGAHAIWNDSGLVSQQQYERLRGPNDPPTFDEYLANRDPLINAKARLNLIVKSFDNEILGQHINKMKWAVLNVEASSLPLLTSDRPVGIVNLKNADGFLSLPISPTKIFVAANQQSTLDLLGGKSPKEIVKASNKFVVARARKYVWACDDTQKRFVENNMSIAMESIPFFPSLQMQ